MTTVTPAERDLLRPRYEPPRPAQPRGFAELLAAAREPDTRDVRDRPAPERDHHPHRDVRDRPVPVRDPRTRQPDPTAAAGRADGTPVKDVARERGDEPVVASDGDAATTAPDPTTGTTSSVPPAVAPDPITGTTSPVPPAAAPVPGVPSGSASPAPTAGAVSPSAVPGGPAAVPVVGSAPSTAGAEQVTAGNVSAVTTPPLSGAAPTGTVPGAGPAQVDPAVAAPAVPPIGGTALPAVSAEAATVPGTPPEQVRTLTPGPSPGVEALLGQRPADALAAPGLPTAAPSAATPLEPALVSLVHAARLQQGATRVVLRLDPPELGTVTVSLTVRGSEVHVALLALDNGSSALLQERRESAQRALADAGLNLVGWDVGEQPRERRGPAPRAHAEDELLARSVTTSPERAVTGLFL